MFWLSGIIRIATLRITPNTTVTITTAPTPHPTVTTKIIVI